MRIPFIENNAFINNKAINIICPKKGKLNDHCFLFHRNRWHFLSYQGIHGIGGQSITNKIRLTYRLQGLTPYARKYELWAPCSVIFNNKVYVYFAVPKMKWKSNWKNFARYVENGGLFSIVLAQAPAINISKIRIIRELFSEDGGARDPFIFYDRHRKLWIMLYAKRIYENKRMIESGIAYRVSSDLISWSDRLGYVVRNLFYDDKIKDRVTISLGNGESPQLIKHMDYYYLFVTHVGYRNYHRTKVWASKDPLNFSIKKDHINTIYAHAPEIIKEKENWYISNCGEHHKEFGETGKGLRVPGIEIARLLWT
ncbi:MAG: hypothetical protein PHS44_04440 [Candidatus Dojkabacteria bacterium]|nr:hypothetical protein [Candidatus Dojkabacteria bacterium]